MSDPERSDRLYQVVVNDEEQYSIWPADHEIPGGWRAVGVMGPRARCLAHIEQAWADMRPKSLREDMERGAPTDRPPS